MMRVIACTCSCLAFVVSALNNNNPHIIQRPTIATTVVRRPTTLLQGRLPGENKEKEVSTSADDSRKNNIAVDLKQIRDEVRELQQSSPLMLARPLATTTAEESSSLDVIPTTDNGDKLVAAVNVAILGAATFGMATVWNNLLVDFEWMQAWRYTWPCVGFLFMYEGYRGLADEFGLVGGTSSSLISSSSSSSSFISKIASARSTADNQRDNDDISLAQLASDTISLQADRPVWLRTIAILAGASLVIGGAADALLPVYVTGPNLFTRAGLAPDAAAFLASYQAFVLMGRVWPSDSSSSSTNNNINLTICAAHVLLLSQLLILGAGSFEDAVTLISENVSAAV